MQLTCIPRSGSCVQSKHSSHSHESKHASHSDETDAPSSASGSKQINVSPQQAIANYFAEKKDPPSHGITNFKNIVQQNGESGHSAAPSQSESKKPALKQDHKKEQHNEPKKPPV